MDLSLGIICMEWKRKYVWFTLIDGQIKKIRKKDVEVITPNEVLVPMDIWVKA